ncbi:LamG domain-containing protein [bacterium]|nr:LamG domain-containing protein [bacterium]
MALSNAPSESNVNENWLFQFSADNNNCLEFDGTGDRIDFGDILQSYTEFTIEFWMKADAVNSGVVIQLSAGSGEDAEDNVSFNVNMPGSAELQLFYEYGSGSNESNTTSDFDLTTNTWIHVAVVRDDASGTALFYKNGVLVETETASNAPSDGTSSSANMSIGNNFANSNGFDGELAHVRVWSDARSAAEIAHYYNRTIDSTASNLVGYWKLDEGTGSTVADSSSNSNSGTITDAQWSIGGFDEFIYSFGVATNDTTLDNNFYSGAVLNSNVNVRDSIDITSGQSSTSNIRLNIANIIINGIDIYKQVFNATNNYLNKAVRVYAQFSGSDSISDCQRIFTGRLVDIQVNQNQTLSLQINSHRPWDKISFPQLKHQKYNVYAPIVYGSYTFSDANSGATNDAAYGGVFPVPILYTNRNMITTVMPRAYTSNSNCYLHHYVGFDHFCSLKIEGSSIVDTTSVQNNVNILETPTTHRATGFIRTNQSSFDFSGSVTYLTNPQNATDYNLDTGAFTADANDSSTYATADINNIDDIRYLAVQTPNKQFEVTLITGVIVKHSILWDDGSGDSQRYNIDFFSNQYDSTDDDLLSSPATRDLSSNISTHTDNFNATPGNAVAGETALVCPDELLIKYVAKNAFGHVHEDHELKVYDVQMRYENRFNYGDNDRKRLADLKYFYCGGAGISASWDDGVIAHGHDAHRDLLMRFGGLSKDTPTNYDSLNTDRAIDNWKIRYWQLEPTSLKDKLDRLAYEFGFCYKIDNNGVLKYIHVKQSSELSATLNLSKNDLDKINVSTTGLSEVITKMDISNKLHPAEGNRYYKTITATNATTRAKYNLGDKEGIQQQNLDMNVGVIPTSAASDCNADWYSYYNNIIGDIKVLVQCDVVNPAKGCQLETGDIVTFTDMPVEMFGTDFSTSTYFMIVETKRSPGKVSITAREVG